jgi:hypothetical protein
MICTENFSYRIGIINASINIKNAVKVFIKEINEVLDKSLAMLCEIIFIVVSTISKEIVVKINKNGSKNMKRIPTEKYKNNNNSKNE